jgi:hypothetical protein
MSVCREGWRARMKVKRNIKTALDLDLSSCVHGGAIIPWDWIENVFGVMFKSLPC